MWLEKFFQIIDNSFVGRYIDKRIKIVDSTDPDRIYVENIRSFYNLTTPLAKIICNMAVKENLFKKRIGIECPTCGRLITHFQNVNEIPDSINCETCELLEHEKHNFQKSELKETVFYQLNKLAV